MPRPAKGARLWLQPAETDPRTGLVRKQPVWVIRDGGAKVSTGCAPRQREDAERKLAAYITTKYQVPRERGRHPTEISIADVLNIYQIDVAPQQARPKEVRQRVIKLSEFWGKKTLSEVNGRACRDYVEWRTRQAIKAARPDATGKPARFVTAAGARRELEDLRASINHHRKEGLCSEVIEVVLPDKSPPRERWLTRSEAARLLWAAIRYRETQKGAPTDRKSRWHVARFILIGLYTGTRAGAICAAGFNPGEGRAWIDLERGVFYRRGDGEKLTNKRRPSIRLPGRLLAHIRRWHEISPTKQAVVEFNGRQIGTIRKAFAAVVADAGIDSSVTPHILRHTCATWMMLNGADLWEAAGYLGMTVEQLQSTYGHHHPDHQAGAAAAATGKAPVAKPERKVVAL
ncbi:MAG: hypothetical protein B7Y61_19455 [Rhizobiales bacterium 35-66-30]|nr:MAG: hypothetical protein B7Y61_19455 [Rhizobiales bacterium 35-66-30]OZA92609.1 MAG: hypothetical protein B7X67_28875 [Rhizobiales bacterium 39-66-18]